MPLVRIAAVAMLLALSGCQQSETPTENETAAAADPRGVDRANAGKTAPDAELRDAENEPATLADLKGEAVLVNIWATWCAPCVKELPTLQALAAAKGAPRVVAVSQDMAPRGSVEAFLEKNKLAGLEVWHDPKMALSSAAGAQILPTTILYDAEGKELWRYVGDLDWNGEEARKLLAELPDAAKR